jgi:hypothetical protein
MDRAQKGFNEAVANVASEYHNISPKFTVNLQPGISDLVLAKNQPSDGLNWVSQLDCFHPSLCSNQVVSSMLVSVYFCHTQFNIYSKLTAIHISGIICFNRGK